MPHYCWLRVFKVYGYDNAYIYLITHKVQLFCKNKIGCIVLEC